MSHIAQAKAAVEQWEKNPVTAPKVSGIFECHIFCEPLNPSQEEIARFSSVCEQLGLRPLCLALNFDGKGMISVLQTTKWFETTTVDAVKRMIVDAEAVSKHFSVIRLKLEAVATNTGVPVTDQQALDFGGGTYFEYHLKLNRALATAEHDEVLKDLSSQLCRDFNIRIPFSCNNLGTNTQRFINARTYHLGFQNSSQLVGQIVNKLGDKGYSVDKLISEFIVYDTNKDLDRGWLEPVA